MIAITLSKIPVLPLYALCRNAVKRTVRCFFVIAYSRDPGGSGESGFPGSQRRNITDVLFVPL